MTWVDLVARGRGVPAFAFAIDGIRYVAGTHSTAPTDAWYTGGGHSYLPGLRADSLSISCHAHPGEVWPETGTMDIEVDDPTETLLPYLRPLDSCDQTRLALTVAAADVTLTESHFSHLPPGMFAEDADLYINQEALRVGVPAPPDYPVTRGRYGSQARQHLVDLDLTPACEPIVSDGPGDLLARRCRLYAGEVVAGELSEMTQVWVGYVYAAPRYDVRRVTIPVAHVLQLFRQGEVLGYVATGLLRGLYVPNYTGHRWGQLLIREFPIGSNTVVDVVPDGSAQFFDTPAEFLAACQVALVTAAAPVALDEHPDGRIRARYTGGAGGSAHFGFQGRAHHLLGWPLGEVLFITDAVAPEHPAHTFADLRRDLGFYPRLYLRPGEASRFALAQVRLERDGGEPTELRQVTEIDAVNDYLGIAEVGAVGSGDAWPDHVLLRGTDAPPAVRQVWRLDCDLADAVRALWSGTVYGTSRPLDYSVPVDWLAGPALHDDDVDWTALRDLCSSIPPCLNRVTILAEEARDVDDILGAALFAAGIYAAVGADGRVTWHRARVPSAGEAVGHLGAEHLVATRVPDLGAELGADGLINAVKLLIPDTTELWHEEHLRPLYIYSRESLQRYGRHAAKNLTKNAKELQLPISVQTVASTPDLETQIGHHLAGTILGLMGRPRPHVELPTGVRARRVNIGEVLTLTTPWLWDLADQRAGVEAKPVLVTGWRRSLGYQGEDSLTVLLIDDQLGCISPAALATSYNQGTRTLTFADTHRYHLAADFSDLDFFEVGDVVRFWSFDSEAPNLWSGTVASLSAGLGTVVLTADEFGVGFPAGGVVMGFATYSQCVSSQQTEGWVWLGAAGDGQVEDLRDAWQWST